MAPSSGQDGLSKAPSAPPPPGGLLATQTSRKDSTLTYSDVSTGDCPRASTCAKPYCVSTFLLKREVYLAIINK